MDDSHEDGVLHTILHDSLIPQEIIELAPGFSNDCDDTKWTNLYVFY